MANEIHWTSATARKEFLRRERDILAKHRMERDNQTALDQIDAYLRDQRSAQMMNEAANGNPPIQ